MMDWKAEGMRNAGAILLDDGFNRCFPRLTRQHRRTLYSIAEIASALDEAHATHHTAYMVFLDIHCVFDTFQHDTIFLHFGITNLPEGR